MEGIEIKWASKPTFRKMALDLGLKTAGAVACYTVGTIAGDVMEHVPYLSQGVSQAINYVSDINIEGNLGGLMGLVGGIYGLKKSGSEICKDDPSRLEKIQLGPVKLTIPN